MKLSQAVCCRLTLSHEGLSAVVIVPFVKQVLRWRLGGCEGSDFKGDERVASSEAELGRRDVMDAKVLELSNDEIVTNRGLSLSG